MPRPTLVFVVALSLTALARSIGAQTILTPSGGHLAVRAAGSNSWTLPHSNESLPDKGELRTSHTGPVHITLGRRRLHVDRNARLNLDGQNSTIELFRGRISARLPEDWSIRAGELVPQDPVEGRKNRKGVSDVGPWAGKYVRGFELGTTYHRHDPG